MDIYVNVSEQKLQVSGYPRKFVAGTVDFVKFIFTLNDKWEDLLVTAQFEQDGKSYYQYLDDNNSVYLPAGLTDGLCELSLYGTNGIITATSEKVVFKILENTFNVTGSGLNQSGDMYSQLVDKLLGIKSSFDIWIDNVSEDFSVLQSRINAIITSMSANKIQMGRVGIETTEDDTVTEYSVVFDSPFESAPIVVCNPITSIPQKVFVSPTGTSKTGFTIKLYRQTAIQNTDVFWIAVSPDYFSNSKEESELADSRIGYDGAVYETLGDAIREQIKSLILGSSVTRKDSFGNLSTTENAIDSKLVGFTVYGKTINAGGTTLVTAASNGYVEIGTGNRNFIKLTPGYVKTSNGIKLTVNDDMSIHLEGTATAKTFHYLPLATTIPKGTPLYYYAKVINGNGNGSIRVNLNGANTSKSAPFETTVSYLDTKWTNDCNQFEINIEAGETVDVTIQAIVSISEKILSYKAPVSSIASIPVSYGLSSVPVTSGGNYTDEDGQQYICDTIEYLNGSCKIVRRIGVIESYNGESITTPYLSTSSVLTIGKPVVYVLPSYSVEEIDSDLVDCLNQLLTYRDFTVFYTSNNLFYVNPQFIYRISLEGAVKTNTQAIQENLQVINDICNGFDGVSYDTAGIAVRTQINNVNDKINSINNRTSILENNMMLTTDNLIDTRVATDWYQGSITPDNATSVLFVHSDKIPVTEGTLYFGGADSQTQISAIHVYTFTDDENYTGKIKMISDVWSNNKIEISQDVKYIVVDISIKPGLGGITPEKLANLSPLLFVSTRLYTESDYEYKRISFTANAIVNKVSKATELAGQNKTSIEELTSDVEETKSVIAEIETAVAQNDVMSWRSALARMPQFMYTETTEAKCITTYGNYLYVCGAYRMEKWDVSIEFNPQLISKAYPLSGLSMKAYQMCTSKDGQYLYMAARLRTPGYTGEAFAGGLFILKTEDMSVVKRIEYNAKASGVEMNKEGTLLAVNLQLGGWVLYDIASNAAEPIELFRKTETAGQQTIEYQKGEFLSIGDNSYYTVAGYIDGIKIWNITDTSNATLVTTIENWNISGLENSHVFDVTIRYPYVYCTIAPITTYVNTEGAPYGILVLDITDLSDIKNTFVQIPVSDINIYSAGDPNPCEIEQYKNKLILNNGNQGLAVFDITDESNPVYRGCIPCDSEEAHSLHVTKDGRLFVGTAYIEPFTVRIFRGI